MKRLLLTGFALLTLGMGTLVLQAPTTAYADTKSEICGGANAAAGATACTDGAPALNKVMSVVVNVLSVVIGIVAVIMIMIAGFKYITSGGDGSSVASAKSTLIYALVGLVIVAFAQLIVKWVLVRLTK